MKHHGPLNLFFRQPTQVRWIQLLLIGGIVFFIIGCILLASVPPVSRDALTHHLAVPKIYLQKGGLVELPDVWCSYFPQNLQLLYIIPLYFDNDIVPKYIHFIFALLTAGLIFHYLRYRTGYRYALFGVLLFLSLPVIVKLSITVYVDLGLIFFTTASLILLFAWMENGFQTRYLILAAVSCGLAMGTKYNGLISFVLLSLFAPIIYVRRASPSDSSQLKALGAGLLFCLVALLVFSPWMARNTLWKGNPIHPLYKGLFIDKSLKPAAPAVSIQSRQPQKLNSASRKQPNHFWIRKHLFGEPWWQTALIPVRIFFEGRDDDPRTFDGRLNPLLFLLPWFAFIGFRSNSADMKTMKLLLLAYSVLYLLIAYFTADMRIRYVSPIIPPLVLLSAFGLQEMAGAFTRYFNGWRIKMATGVLCLFLATMIGLNFVYIREQFSKYEPIEYISGRVSRDEYITRYRPAYPVIQYANRNLSDDAKILSLFQGNRRYYSDQDMVHSNKLFRRIIEQASSAKDVQGRLHRRRFTHLLIHVSLFKDWAAGAFDNIEVARLNLFFQRHTKQLMSAGGYMLLELSSTSIAQK